MPNYNSPYQQHNRYTLATKAVAIGSVGLVLSGLMRGDIPAGADRNSGLQERKVTISAAALERLYPNYTIEPNESDSRYQLLTCSTKDTKSEAVYVSTNSGKDWRPVPEPPVDVLTKSSQVYIMYADFAPNSGKTSEAADQIFEVSYLGVGDKGGSIAVQLDSINQQGEVRRLDTAMVSGVRYSNEPNGEWGKTAGGLPEYTIQDGIGGAIQVQVPQNK